MAEVAAAVALVAAAAASTIKAYFALLALVVKGWLPELVCASVTIKMLLVLVSLIMSRTAYVVLVAQSPLNVPSSCVTARLPEPSKEKTLLALSVAEMVNSAPVSVLVSDALIARSSSS